MTCPDSSCHEKLKTVCTAVHGKDGLESKVSRKALGGVVISVIGVLAIFVIYALGAAAVAKDERKANAAKAEVLETAQNLQFKNIKELITEFKDTQKEALRELKENQITTGDIYRVVKRVMKENGD